MKAKTEIFTIAEAKQFLKHCKRERGENGEYVKHPENSKIKPAYTRLNHTYKEEGNITPEEHFDKISKETGFAENKKVVACLTITMPSNYYDKYGDPWKFFMLVDEFLTEELGSSIFLEAYVHIDEDPMHMHYCIIPREWDDTKDDWVVDYKNIVKKSTQMILTYKLADYLAENLQIPEDIFIDDIEEEILKQKFWNRK